MSPPLPDPYELLLCQIPGLQARHVVALLEQWGDARAIIGAPAAMLRAAGVPPAIVARIVAGQRQVTQVAAGLKGLARLAITPIPLVSAAYPERLRQSTEPPLLIYVQGAWPPGEPLVTVTVHRSLPAEREPIIRDWLARLPGLGLVLGAGELVHQLVPPVGTLFAVSYGLMLARQRLPIPLREAIQSNQATLMSAVAINAPPDERSAVLTEAMLLRLSTGQLALDSGTSADLCVPLHFVLAFKDEPVDGQAAVGKRLRPNAAGGRVLARALGIRVTATATVQQQRLL
ncbi:MAG: hypothetical protein H0X37_25235 [Herpetosiphonaceae bacterium]|nr:hypothetical protein [Herpetosiphonaceae bacterium]